MNVAFFNQNALVQRETAAALRRLSGVRVVAIDLCRHPSADQAREVVRLLEKQQCRMLVTVNDGGIDADGVLGKYLDGKKIVHCNWYVDDPFYEEIILVKKYRPSPTRIDFVSDKGYVEPMRDRGYRAFFLPLAADPDIFNPGNERERQWRDEIVFVGNSYNRQMNDLLKMAPGFIDTLSPFIGKVVDRFCRDVGFDVEGYVAGKLKKISLPRGVSMEKADFIARHTAGYLARKRIILSLVERYPGFKVYGEPGWRQYIPGERLGTAKYYDNLCEVYRHAKITVDINRMVIRNGFTQRAFDVPASGGFLITGAKPVVGEFFDAGGPERELAVFNSVSELTEEIDWFLAHEDERLAVAQRGMRKVLAAHTYDHRIAEMFRVIARELR